MIVDGKERDHYAISLKDQIQAKFEDIHHPKEVLANFEKYQQENMSMDEFITNFNNLRIKSQISDDYTKWLLFKNVRY